MALKGTIEDFGVADILQLISQQLKTGVLVFRHDKEEVDVIFLDGTLVGAEHSSRGAEGLFGNLLVRAEVITQRQLDNALAEQKRTLQKLGDLLVDKLLATPSDIKEFARLQMTETVYRLFEWRDGTYEFEAKEIDSRTIDVEPMRVESVVMNGIRMIDEWPGIREKITTYSWWVEPMRSLPEVGGSGDVSDEFDLSSLSEFDVGTSGRSDVGDYERRVFKMLAPGRSVQEIIDLSRLGEFETCAALSILMSEGYIRVIKPPEQEDARSKINWGERIRRGVAVLGRVAVSVGIVVVTALLLSQVSPLLGRDGLEPGARFVPTPVDDRIAEAQLRILRRAVEVYRYHYGAYPQRTEQLVTAGLVRSNDLHFPYREPYYYVVSGDRFVLLRPFR